MQAWFAALPLWAQLVLSVGGALVSAFSSSFPDGVQLAGLILGLVFLVIGLAPTVIRLIKTGFYVSNVHPKVTRFLWAHKWAATTVALLIATVIAILGIAVPSGNNSELRAQKRVLDIDIQDSFIDIVYDDKVKTKGYSLVYKKLIIINHSEKPIHLNLTLVARKVGEGKHGWLFTVGDTVTRKWHRRLSRAKPLDDIPNPLYPIITAPANSVVQGPVLRIFYSHLYRNVEELPGFDPMDKKFYYDLWIDDLTNNVRFEFSGSNLIATHPLPERTTNKNL